MFGYVTAVTGACLAFRREVWEDLGGFDRRFPVNYNDIDFCLRALGYERDELSLFSAVAFYVWRSTTSARHTGRHEAPFCAEN
jgi:O-antigen biosynthesis protein